MDFKQVKSINVNTVFDKKTVKENMNKPLFTVSGFADEIITADTKYGEQIGFSGDFTAVNLVTGECYESNAAFLPKGLAKQLEKMLEANPQNTVQVDATISAIESDKNDKGYAWIANKPMTEERVKRRFELLEKAKKEAEKIKLIAAPEKVKKSA